MSEWQPIETAPLNTDVLAWDAGCLWPKAYIASCTDPWHWYSDDASEDGGYRTLSKVTHWMPLPDPPTSPIA